MSLEMENFIKVGKRNRNQTAVPVLAAHEIKKLSVCARRLPRWHIGARLGVSY
jgi:hypothetical protein